MSTTPDPVHERFHGDGDDAPAIRAFANNITQQMQEALKSIPREKPHFPGSPTFDPRRLGFP